MHSIYRQKLEPLTPYFGISVRGVDVTNFTDENFELYNRILHKHQAIRFCDQNCTENQLIHFSSHFGQLGQTDGSTLDNHKYQYKNAQLLYMDSSKLPLLNRVTGLWHSDYSFRAEKSINWIVLHAKKTPKSGGQTLLCDMRSVLKSVSPELQSLLRSLRAVHDSSSVRRRYLQTGVISKNEFLEASTRMETAEWPLICCLPNGHGEYIYINPRHTDHITGLNHTESAMILDLIYRLSIDSDYVYSHPWRTGDLLIFSNLSLMHRAVDSYCGEREIWKVCVYGPNPSNEFQ